MDKAGEGRVEAKQFGRSSWGMISQSTASKLVSYYIDNTGWTSMEGIRSDYVGSMVSILYIVVSK